MGFVTDRWYLAAWEQEVATSPIRRIVLDHPLVIFRTSGGTIAILQDRCSHRAVPLSMGRVHGEAIECAYHGLRFDTSGTCIHNPHVKRISRELDVLPFETTIRHGAVWVWIGQSPADETLVPDFGRYAASPKNSVVRGNLYVKADYRLVVDNLLDLSHAEFVHLETVGTLGSAETVETRVVHGDDWVTVERKVFDIDPSPLFRPMLKSVTKIDKQSNMTWHAPSYLSLDLAVMPAGGDDADALHFPSAHILTPETEKTTHYFWASARDFLIDDQTVDVRVQGMMRKTFDLEDRPILEACQENLDLPGADQTLINFTVGDSGALRVRKILDAQAWPGGS